MNQRDNQKRSPRRGAAVVELAVCLPILLLVILCGMDAVQVIRTKQAAIEAVHETARIVAINAVDEQGARNTADKLLRAKGLRNASVEFSPPPSLSMSRGTPMSIRLSVPVEDNCTPMLKLFANQTVEARTTVVRELGAFAPGGGAPKPGPPAKPKKTPPGRSKR